MRNLDTPLRWLRTRRGCDQILAAVAAGTILAVVLFFDAFERFWSFSRSHEAWQLDELLLFAALLGFVFLLFSYRRTNDSHEALEETLRLAGLDPVTGAPNRRQFLSRLGKLQGSEDCAEHFAVFVLDLDDFHPVNDLYGNRVGDEVLRIMARRLEEVAGDRAFVARIGGDEFGVLFPFDSDEAVQLVAQRIISRLPEPMRIAALSLRVDVSVGIACWIDANEPSCGLELDELASQDGSPVETLLRRADMALMETKQKSGTSYQFFRPEMEAQLRERRQLEQEIASAIASGQIVPYYQPLVDLKTDSVTGCEVLARWNHPTRGLLSPAVFIPVAEATGNLSRLTFTLLRHAIKDAKSWADPISISVNWPALMTSDNWSAAELLRILTESGFPAERLELEITETALIENPEEAARLFKSLRNVGVRIALDDFGSGYSGLSYLREFEIDRVKLDRAYVQEIMVDPRAEALVWSIISFCHSLGLSVTAEGLETLPLKARLLELGCDIGQGYLFSKPKPSRRFDRFVRSRPSEPPTKIDRRKLPAPYDGEGIANKGTIELEALDLLPSQVALLDRQGNIIHTNRAWDVVAEGRPTDQGRNYLEECRAASDRGCTEALAIGEGIGKVLRREADEFTGNYPCPFGRRHHWHQIAVRPGRASDKEIGAIVTHTDVTSLQHDHLTGLANRALFESQTQYALDTARENASAVGVALIDLDGFKPINDEYGHAAGDAVLIEVANRLTSAVGDSLVARIGGDEFGVVTWIGSNEVALSRLARDAKLAFKKPFLIEGAPVAYLSASIGTALYPTDGETLETLLKSADSRMYGLKKALRRQTQKSTA